MGKFRPPPPLLHEIPKEKKTQGRPRKTPPVLDISSPDSDPALLEEVIFCFRSRVQGYTPDQIALMSEEVLPTRISPQRVIRNLDMYSKRMLEKPAEEYKELELQRLDYYLTRLRQKIDLGDEKAITVAVRISEHRSKLLGILADQKITVKHEHTEDPEVMEAIRIAQKQHQSYTLQRRKQLDNIVEAEVVETIKQVQQGETDSGE